ncbi:MAG: hypothetical protein ACE5HQ_04315 [Gemmatimonadota bacterium]
MSATLRNLWKILPLLGLLILVPASISPSQGVEANEACAAGGSQCCPASMSICLLTAEPLYGYYETDFSCIRRD